VLAQALGFARRHQMRAVIYTRWTNFAIRRGWQDWFEPCLNETVFPLARYDRIFDQPLPVRILRYLNARYQSVWHRLPCTPGYQAFQSVMAFRDAGLPDIARSLWRPHPWLRADAEERRSALRMSEPYLALHLRRGDKHIEADPTATESYAGAVRSAGLKNVLVLTDDYGAFKDLQDSLPGYALRTLCPPEARGHDQDRFNARGREWRRQQHAVLFAEILLALGSRVFVGTASSNLSRLVMLLRSGENCLSLSGRLLPDSLTCS
jgi:hypothetical protein